MKRLPVMALAMLIVVSMPLSPLDAVPVTSVNLGCLVATEEPVEGLPGWALQRRQATLVDLTPMLERLFEAKPLDGAHRIFTTEAGMTISVVIRAGEIAGYDFDRKVTVEYEKFDFDKDYGVPKAPEEKPPEGEGEGGGFTQPDGPTCPGNSVPCIIWIGNTGHIGCCEPIL